MVGDVVIVVLAAVILAVQDIIVLTASLLAIYSINYKMSLKKFSGPVLFFSMIFCFFEIFSRYGYILFPYEDHQRYGHTKHRDYGLSLKIKANGRSAMGDIFKGQKTQIAFFGTSTLFHGVSRDTTWPELLQWASHEPFHVDNFAFFTESAETLKEKLNNLCSLKRFYYMAVVSFSNTNSLKINPGYHDRFRPSYKLHPSQSKKSLQTYQQIKKWYERSQSKITFVFDCFQKLFSFFDSVGTKNQEPPLPSFTSSNHPQINWEEQKRQIKKRYTM